MAAEQHSTRSDDANAPGPVVGRVRVPPEMIVASGVGREVTNWHRDLAHDTADSDAAVQERVRGRGGE